MTPRPRHNTESRPNAPHYSHPARELFETAVFSGNQALEMSIRLDVLVEKLRGNRWIDNQMMEEVVKKEQDLILEALPEISQSPSSSITDIERLTTQASLLREMVVVPRIFDDTESSYQDRSAASEGVLGINAQIIQNQLMQYHSSNIVEEKQMLLGAINEQTAMAVVNLGNTGNAVALPALTYQDILHGTDMHIHVWGSNHSYSIHPYQIKTAFRKQLTPRGIPTIFMSEPNDRFRMSAAIAEAIMSPSSNGGLKDVQTDIDQLRKCILSL